MLSTDLSAHTPLPFTGNFQACWIRVNDQEGCSCQLKVVSLDQVLD